MVGTVVTRGRLSYTPKVSVSTEAEGERVSTDDEGQV